MQQITPLFLMLVTLVACPSQQDGTAGGSRASATTSAAEATPPVTASATRSKARVPVTFEHAEHGFELTLPAGWELSDEDDQKAREAAALKDASEPKVVQAFRKQESELLSARRGKDTRLTARVAPDMKPAQFIDAYLKAPAASSKDKAAMKVSTRAKLLLAGRPFQTVRLVLERGSDHRLVFATESKGGALLFVFTSSSNGGLNQLARLFKQMSFSKKGK